MNLCDNLALAVAAIWMVFGPALAAAGAWTPLYLLAGCAVALAVVDRMRR